MTADERAVSRDETLRRLMAKYEVPIRRMCCMYLRDADLAADAVQDTFLKAYLALDQFRGESSEKTWLMRIAINTCHSLRRSGWLRFIDRRITLDRLPEPTISADYGLTELEYYAGPISGMYDEATAEAVAAYQESAGLPVTGICGPETHTLLIP